MVTMKANLKNTGDEFRQISEQPALFIPTDAGRGTHVWNGARMVAKETKKDGEQNA